MDGFVCIVDVFCFYGVQFGFLFNFVVFQFFGGFDIFDFFDEIVVNWWQGIVDNFYKCIFDMVGYFVKVNLEGQFGFMIYNCILVDGVNLFVCIFQFYGGIIIFCVFVYDYCSLNQILDWKVDCVNVVVNYFDGFDDKFEDNVVIQIKYGFIDFQVCEFVLFFFIYFCRIGVIVEFQIIQEYFG